MRLHPGLVVLALCCVSQTALAQKVVVLEFEGDKGNKLQKQVEAALKKAKAVDLVPIATWKAAAAKKKLKGPQAMASSAVKRISELVAIDAAIEGALGDTFFVRILDSAGVELWSKDLPLKKGLVSDDHARKLAKAIAAAATTARDKPPEAEAEAEEEKPKKRKDEEVARSTESQEEGEGATEETQEEPARRPAKVDARRAEEDAEAEAASRAAPSEPEKDADLEQERKRKKGDSVRPHIFYLALGVPLTGRGYCSRPGVSSCEEYDALSETERAIGDTVDFSADVPYLGFFVLSEIFPLATLWEKMAGFGFGLRLELEFGFSKITIRTQTPTGPTQLQEVVAVDLDWGVLAAVPRWYFTFGDFKFRGINSIDFRLGVGGRRFQIDDTANVPLPAPDRAYFQLGAGLRIAPVKFIGLDLAVMFFVDPKPGDTVIFGYGDLNAENGGAKSSGFKLEGGLSGQVIGPLGYSLRMRYSNYLDSFIGQGKKWTTPCDSTTSRCGGFAREYYVQGLFGLSLGF